jgi:hypothetical protein
VLYPYRKVAINTYFPPRVKHIFAHFSKQPVITYLPNKMGYMGRITKTLVNGHKISVRRNKLK